MTRLPHGNSHLFSTHHYQLTAANYAVALTFSVLPINCELLMRVTSDESARAP
jgi:hypothetical protein